MQPADDLDNYLATVDFDSDQDPFASPPPEAGKKRKGLDDAGLGIDEEVAVQKRARVPNVKLDEQRLLGPAGIPKLRARAAGLKLKGKGHEFSDAARLLSFYQLWLDDLFPKARFLDALAMVEKAGHKRALQAARQEWINQARPRAPHDADDDNHNDRNDSGRGAADETSLDRPARPSTPTHHDAQRHDRDHTGDDVPDDEDLYDATPRAIRLARDDVPAEDDLETLMAEAEILDKPRERGQHGHAAGGNRGDGNTGHHSNGDAEEEDLDALIAEAEAQEEALGADTIKTRDAQAGAHPSEQHDYADDEDAMREMEGW